VGGGGKLLTSFVLARRVVIASSEGSPESRSICSHVSSGFAQTDAQFAKANEDYAQGKFKEAQEEFQKAATLDPDLTPPPSKKN